MEDLFTVGEYDVQGVEVRVIEMPEPGLGHCAYTQGYVASLARLQGYGGNVVFLQDASTGIIFQHSIAELSLPALRCGVVDRGRNLDAGMVRVVRSSRRKVRGGVHRQPLDENQRSHEQAHRTVNSSVMRPITGTASRQHCLIERAVHLYNNDILNARSEQRGN